MATNSSGYDGQVNEVQWAGLSKFLGAEFAVLGATDWAVSVQTGATLTVKVATGTGYGYGVVDVTDVQETLALDAIATGTRWDLIARRRNWQPAGGTTSLVKITGSSSRVIPAGRLNNPGVTCDQPLALVQVTAGSTLPTAVVDLRTWPRKVTLANDLLAMVNPALGDEVVLGETRFRYGLDASSALVWAPDRSPLQRMTVTPVTAGAVVSTVSGWSAGGAMSNRAFRLGNLVVLDLEFRRTGGRIEAGPTGNMVDLQVGTLVDPLMRPTQQMPIPLQYYGGQEDQPTSFYASHGLGSLYTSGEIRLYSGQTDTWINTRPSSDAGCSVRIHAVYARES